MLVVAGLLVLLVGRCSVTVDTIAHLVVVAALVFARVCARWPVVCLMLGSWLLFHICLIATIGPHGRLVVL